MIDRWISRWIDNHYSFLFHTIISQRKMRLPCNIVKTGNYIYFVHMLHTSNFNLHIPGRYKIFIIFYSKNYMIYPLQQLVEYRTRIIHSIFTLFLLHQGNYLLQSLQQVEYKNCNEETICHGTIFWVYSAYYNHEINALHVQIPRQKTKTLEMK